MLEEEAMGDEMHTIGSESCMDEEMSSQIRTDTPYTPHQVDKLRRHLKFHFMTPCEKFKARRRKPWKLMIQLIKIIVITVQVFALGSQQAEFVGFQHKTRLALEHIMFKHWDPSYETMPYPAATGKYALYKTSSVIDHINYAMTMYNQTQQIAIGVYGFTKEQEHLKSRTAQLYISRFKVGEIFPSNLTYHLDPEIETLNYTFSSVMLPNGTEAYDFLSVLKAKGQTLHINKLHKMELHLPLNGIHIKSVDTVDPLDEPDCLRILAKVLYDNTEHDGQMQVKMDVQLTAEDCYDGSKYDNDEGVAYGLTMALDIIVIIFCVLSAVTCARSLLKSYKLMSKSKEFFLNHFTYTYTWDDKLLFLNLWFVMIILSDAISVAGTILKIGITYHKYAYYDPTTMLLGTSTVLVWLGVMRYFEYFQKYNILVLTCKKALPDVLRFLICAAIVYIAFTICGWLVLGPYHVKFSTIATSSECLFSLVNGDDMYVTFSVIDGRAPSQIWLFSRIYLYTFISLFIYFVLNVFVSVIISAYESIKEHYIEGPPKSFVQRFMDCCQEPPNSPLYTSDIARNRRCHVSPCCALTCCCSSNGADPGDDSVSILT